MTLHTRGHPFLIARGRSLGYRLTVGPPDGIAIPAELLNLTSGPVSATGTVELTEMASGQALAYRVENASGADFDMADELVDVFGRPSTLVYGWIFQNSFAEIRRSGISPELMRLGHRLIEEDFRRLWKAGSESPARPSELVAVEAGRQSSGQLMSLALPGEGVVEGSSLQPNASTVTTERPVRRRRRSRVILTALLAIAILVISLAAWVKWSGRQTLSTEAAQARAVTLCAAITAKNYDDASLAAKKVWPQLSSSLAVLLKNVAGKATRCSSNLANVETGAPQARLTFYLDDSRQNWVVLLSTGSATEADGA